MFVAAEQSVSQGISAAYAVTAAALSLPPPIARRLACVGLNARVRRQGEREK